MFSVKGCILSFLAGAFFFFLVLSSVWWVLTGIAFWLVYFCMENRRSGSLAKNHHPASLLENHHPDPASGTLSPLKTNRRK